MTNNHKNVSNFKNVTQGIKQKSKPEVLITIILDCKLAKT